MERILIIENEPSIMRLVRETLDRDGYSLLSVTDGQ
jgi:CheY-like chemotaxis protein